MRRAARFPSRTTRPPRGPWWTAVVAGMASYLDAAAIVGTGLGLVMYQDALGLDGRLIGRLSGILTAGIAVGAVVGGRLGDRHGRRRVFTATIALYTVGATVLATASTPSALHVGVGLLGFAVGADLPVSLAMIAEEAPARHRGKMITVSHILWMVGVAASLSIGAVFGDTGGPGAQVMFGHMVVAGLVVLVLRSTLPESRAWRALVDAVGRETAGARVPGARALLEPPQLRRLLAIAVFYALVNLAANTAGQFGTYMYVNLAGQTVRTASFVGLALFATSVLGALLFMRVVDGAHRMRWFAVGATLHVCAFAAPALFGVHLWSLVALGIGGVLGASLAGEPIYKVWSQELFSTAVRATAQGVTMATARLLAALVAVWTPVLLDTHQQLFFVLMATGVALAGVVGYAVVGRLSPVREPLPPVTEETPALGRQPLTGPDLT